MIFTFDVLQDAQLAIPGGNTWTSIDPATGIAVLNLRAGDVVQLELNETPASMLALTYARACEALQERPLPPPDGVVT